MSLLLHKHLEDLLTHSDLDTCQEGDRAFESNWLRDTG